MAKISLIKGAQGQPLWVYETGGGESLAAIGERYFVFNQPEAIAAYNGLDEFQASAAYLFPAGEAIAVPIEWVKPEHRKGALVVDVRGGAVGAPQAMQSSGLTQVQWALIIGAAALALTALSR